jgi:hypothetical protein
MPPMTRRLGPLTMRLLVAVLVLAAGPGSASAAPTASDGGSVLRPGAVDRTSLHLMATYDVRATLRFDAGSISVVTDLSVRNTSGGPIDRIELNLVPARIGHLHLDQASVDGHDVHVTVSGQTLVVPLGGTLPEGATIPVRIGYSATFNTSTAGSNWLFAKANGIVEAYRWIPWISRVKTFERPNFGDPFVTPVSPHVKVTLTTDRTLRIASTGFRTSASGLRQVFEASRVRDFNFTAAPDYRTATGYAGQTRIVVYYRSGSGSTILSTARNAISHFASLVGAYPYPDYVIGQSGGGFGMESPGHVWIPIGSATSSLPYLVTHETAHQWFYSAVGNDQVTQPYADEAAADFLARYILDLRRGSRCASARLDLTIYQYSSSCYYEVVYIQGGNYLDDLRVRIGATAFWAALRDYYATWRFKLGGTKHLLEAIDAHTSQDLAPAFHLRFPSYF